MRPICTKNANAQDLILIAAVTVVVVVVGGSDAVSATTVTAVSSCNCRSHSARSYTRAQFPLFA